METDQLIRTLAADNAHRTRSVGFVLALSLLAGAPFSLAMFFASLGVRPDVMTAMHNPFFDLKFLVTAGAGDFGHRDRSASVAAGSLAEGLDLAAADPGRPPGRGNRRRDDDAAAVADDDAVDRQQFAGLHDGDTADIAAAAGGGIDRPASRRAGAARGRRRGCRIGVGGIGGDALRLALHRRFAVVRGDLVHHRHRARHRTRRARGSRVLRF